jgi:hypothetical protein
MKVKNADKSAMPTAKGASQRRRVVRFGSASDGSKDAGAACALVIPGVMLKRVMSAGCGLMHSYHNVAELRQFRGASNVELRIHKQAFACADPLVIPGRPKGEPGISRRNLGIPGSPLMRRPGMNG